MATDLRTLNGHQMLNVVEKTANYTVLAEECGTLFSNNGAAAAITFALPAAVAGLWYDFAVREAQELRIDPNGTETISLPSTGVPSAAGAYITADAVGESVRIACAEAGTWFVRSYTGTWTAV